PDVAVQRQVPDCQKATRILARICVKFLKFDASRLRSRRIRQVSGERRTGRSGESQWKVTTDFPLTSQLRTLNFELSRTPTASGTSRSAAGLRWWRAAMSPECTCPAATESHPS